MTKEIYQKAFLISQNLENLEFERESVEKFFRDLLDHRVSFNKPYLTVEDVEPLKQRRLFEIEQQKTKLEAELSAL